MVLQMCLTFIFSHSHVIHTLLQDYDNAVRPETRKGNSPSIYQHPASQNLIFILQMKYVKYQIN